jgi:GWxTD domain-containing protein
MFPSRRKLTYILFLSPLILALLLSSPSRAQRRTLDNVPERPVDFSISSVPFFDPVIRNSILVIHYRVVNDHLQFIKLDGGFRADFQVVCVVYDDDDKQVTGDEVSGEQWADSYDETNSRDIFVEGHFQFPLSPGQYRMRIWIEGQHTGVMVRTESRTEIPDFKGFDLILSGLLLADEIVPVEMGGEQPSGRYRRRGLVIDPSVTHVYSDQQPLLWCYFEVYDLKDSSTDSSFYRAVYEIINASGETVLSDTADVPREGTVSGAFRDFRVSALEEDQYLLRVAVRDQESGRVAVREIPFQVRWSTLGQVAKDYEEAVEQLRYIATDDEYKKLKAAEGEDRREVWLEFWKERDPTPGTPANEMRTEYYRRIEYANVNFSVVSTGWRTDRGRIYIVYGPPDDIERHPMEIGVKPYQIWHYYNTNRRFYFVDEDGYGDYKLVAWR